MNAQDITNIVVTTFGVLLAFLLDKIVGPYIPEKKKLSSYIKKLLFFMLRYAPAALYTTYFFMTAKTVDKFFVLSMCYGFSLIVINICLHIRDGIRKDQDKIIECLNLSLTVMENQFKAGTTQDEIIAKNILVAEKIISHLREVNRATKNLLERGEPSADEPVI